MKSPSLSFAGHGSTIADSSAARRSAHRSSSPSRRLRIELFRPDSFALIDGTLAKVFATQDRSRGLGRPVPTRATRRSRSKIDLKVTVSAERSGSLSINSSTPSWRVSILLLSASGLANQSFNNRLPIGVWQRSITPNREPIRVPLRMVRLTSKERQVAESISTNCA